MCWIIFLNEVAEEKRKLEKKEKKRKYFLGNNKKYR
jgi:hypothetical protein